MDSNCPESGRNPGSDSPTIERLEYLAKLPLLLNSSLEFRSIVTLALEQLKKFLNAEAATVFLGDDTSETLEFWALRGDQAKNLEGKRMPAKKGIVGWTIEKQESIFIADATKDPRFFKQVDYELDFQTRDLICAPLTVRGIVKLGALEVLNNRDSGFKTVDVEFVTRFAGQLALALDNAQMYHSLREQNTKLSVLNRRKDEVIAIIAHEFRTPLSIIQSSSELISLGRVNELTIAKVTSALQNGVQRLTRLVSEVKNVATIEKGHLPLQLARVSVSELFDIVREQFSVAATDRQIEFQINSAAEDDYVQADYTLLLIVIRNLISNAFRATPDGGQITIQASVSCGLITIAVSDTGIGIAEEQLSLIFEKFYEVADSKQHSSGSLNFRACGLGLGLATAKSILEAHNAKLEVSSSIGQGSCFKFALQAA